MPKADLKPASIEGLRDARTQLAAWRARATTHLLAAKAENVIERLLRVRADIEINAVTHTRKGRRNG